MTTTFTIANGDILINDATGRPHTVADNTKLSQDIKEVLSTEARRDNIGAGLEDVINGSASDTYRVRSSITRRVDAAINNMQSLQNRIQAIHRPSSEMIAAVTQLQVAPLEGSSTDYTFRVVIRTRSGVQITQAGVIT